MLLSDSGVLTLIQGFDVAVRVVCLLLDLRS
jgi:hypothetical protein